jgi:hypothetical protein
LLCLFQTGCAHWFAPVHLVDLERQPWVEMEDGTLRVTMSPVTFQKRYTTMARVRADGTEVCIKGRKSTNWKRPWTQTFDLAELGVPSERLGEATACWVEPDGTRIPLRIGTFDATGESALHYAAAFHLPTLRALLVGGADPNVRNPDNGWTPLHYAARWGQREAEEVLLDHGANPRARGVAGRTPDDVRDTWFSLPQPAHSRPDPPTR